MHHRPDLIESPHCDHERCFAVRGEYVIADILATPHGAHVELLTTVTAFVLGIGKISFKNHSLGIIITITLGVPIPIDPPHDNA